MATYGPTTPPGVSAISPPSRSGLVKIGRIDVADGAVAFQAFGLPKGAFIAGVYTISTGANAGQTVNAGFTASTVELINGATVDGPSYMTSGPKSGPAVGSQLDSDQIVWLKASAALTNPVYVKVEYWIPPPAQQF
jgi:hypothetical protein